jgi:hypothetical protein
MPVADTRSLVAAAFHTRWVVAQAASTVAAWAAEASTVVAAWAAAASTAAAAVVGSTAVVAVDTGKT